MRELRIARTLAAWLCLVAVLFALTAAPSSASVDFALPVLVFCFLLPLACARVPAFRLAPALPSVPALSLRAPRAPPLA